MTAWAYLVKSSLTWWCEYNNVLIFDHVGAISNVAQLHTIDQAAPSSLGAWGVAWRGWTATFLSNNNSSPNMVNKIFRVYLPVWCILEQGALSSTDGPPRDSVVIIHTQYGVATSPCIIRPSLSLL